MKRKVICLLMSLLLLLTFPVAAMAEDDSSQTSRPIEEPDVRQFYEESKEHKIVSQESGMMYAQANGFDFRISVTYLTEGDWEYYVNTGGTATITDYNGVAASVITPTKLGGISVTQIGSYTFLENLNITSVTISEGVTQLGDEKYSGGSELFGNVFEYCENLTTVNLPATLQKLGSYSFIGCPSLANITVASGNTIFMVDNGILFSDSDTNGTFDVLELYPAAKSNLTTYTVPSNIVTISDYAFDLNESLTSITLPSSLRTCDTGVANLPNLTTVSVANGIEAIGGFTNCPKLVNVSLPNSVTQYGWRAFAFCEKLTNIVHPANIQVFDDECFVATGLSSVTLPASVNYFGLGAFGLCFNLTSINVDIANTYYKSIDGVLFSKDEKTLHMYPVGKTATRYTVPDEVEVIFSNAFTAAFLDEITLPQSLLVIGAEAFMLNNFTAVTIPKNVTEIGYYAFMLNDNLEKFIVYSDNPVYDDYGEDVGMFDGNNHLVMYGNGSTLSYAIKFGIPFGTITTSMSLDMKNLRMWPYTSAYLTATTTPAGGYVTWSSSNPSVADVDSNGTVTANGLGTATITATSLYQTASCTVSVFAPNPIQFTCYKRNVSTYGGSDGAISVSVSPYMSAGYEASIDGGVSWKGNCSFTGLTAGTYTVIVRDAYYKYNSASASVTIDHPASMGNIPANKIPTKVYASNYMTITPPAPPKGYTVQSITYASSNPAVASVDASGVVVFLAGGKVMIMTKVVSQTVDKKGKIKTKTTTVKKTIAVKQPVASITLPITNTTIARTQKVSLNANIQPATASDKKLIWKSSNPKVATVNAKGVVVGKAGGTAVITCTAKDGSGKTASCTVNVTPIYPTGIKLSKASLSLKTGKAGTLKATVAPKNTDFKTVTWASSNTAVVTVNAKGKLMAIAPGTAVVTAATSSGQIASCTVTVR